MPERFNFHTKVSGNAITFDDVLLVPAYSEVVPKGVSTATRVTNNITLNIPILSAAMDTVTESALAIALAQEGGLGIIHKNLSIESQAAEVRKVKRSENGVITDPVTLPPTANVGTARRMMEQYNISGVPIVEGRRLVGILTNRDLRFQRAEDSPVSSVMTKDHLITAPPDTTLDQAKDILHKRKVEKLLLVDKDFNLVGLITIKDINKIAAYPNACKDGRGRLRVGAAVGVNDDARVEALVNNDVDVIVVDTAHGHSKGVIEAVKRIKSKWKIDIIAGNIATGDGAKALFDAGADAVKVGIGPGAICTTRVISGVGVPQISAIMECAAAAARFDKQIIADGGITQSGDITKALAAGANCVMIGTLFAGLAESPGEIILYKGRSFKMARGMGSLGAMVAGSDRYPQASRDKLVPEGVEGRVPYKGPLSDFVYQLVGGLRAGMGYCGAATIDDLRSKARFIMVSAAGIRESHPHDIVVTKEAPNYRMTFDEES
jgi:IMP dehydrogenase